MRDIALSLLARDFQIVPQIITGTASQQWVQFVPQNASRWGLIVILHSGTMRFGINPDANFQDGFHMSTTGQEERFMFRDWGGLVSSPWYYVDGNTPVFTVYEVLYRPAG